MTTDDSATDDSATDDSATDDSATDDSATDIGGHRLGGIVRRVRRTADLSQRELAKRAGVSPSCVGAIESGTLTPSLATLQRVLDAAGFHLVVCDADDRRVVPLEVWQDVEDGASRRFPAHLDTILDPAYGEWWADVYGLARPPETFRRDRRRRDYERARSRWEVRAKQLRDVAPPRAPLKPWSGRVSSAAGGPAWFAEPVSDEDAEWADLPPDDAGDSDHLRDLIFGIVADRLFDGRPEGQFGS